MSPSEDLRWSGCLTLGPWWLLYAGAFGPTAEHRHHAAQVLACPSPVTVDFGSEAIAAEMIVIPADQPHRIVDGCGRGTVLFIDGDARQAAALSAGVATPPPTDVELDPARMTYRQAVSGAEALLSSTGISATRPDSLSEEIQESMRLIDDDRVASATELAARVGLSASEFSRRFSRETGLPYRSYRKWRRLVVAIETLACGANLTIAAHAAGFADSAHLTRTFKTTFGIAPSELTSTSRWLPPE